jgi:NitT/TauT family transport system substrate-binding protein
LKTWLFSILLARLLVSSVSAAGTQTVTIGTSGTSADVAFFIADKKGYFRDAGIQPQMVPFQSAAMMIAPLGAGQLDVGGGTVAAGLYNAVSRGINVKVVADRASVKAGYEYSTLLVRKDLVDSGRYKSLKDLKAMTISTAGQGAGSESALNEALKKGGLKYSDANVVYMGFPETLAAFKNKAIDAGIVNEPTLSRLLADGLAVRANPGVIYPGQQTAVLLYSEAFSARRDVAEKFMVAYLRALRYYNDALADGKLSGPKGDDIVNILMEYTKVKDAAGFREMTPFAVNANGYVNTKSLVNDLGFYKSRGLIQDPNLGVGQIIDSSFVQAAGRELGSYRPSAR